MELNHVCAIERAKQVIWQHSATVLFHYAVLVVVGYLFCEQLSVSFAVICTYLFFTVGAICLIRLAWVIDNTTHVAFYLRHKEKQKHRYLIHVIKQTHVQSYEVDWFTYHRVTHGFNAFYTNHKYIGWKRIDSNQDID